MCVCVDGGVREYSQYICESITQAVDFLLTRNLHRLQSCVSLPLGLTPPRCMVFGIQTTSRNVKGLNLATIAFKISGNSAVKTQIS